MQGITLGTVGGYKMSNIYFQSSHTYVLLGDIRGRSYFQMEKFLDGKESFYVLKEEGFQ